jgi:divalent metal cation (Fe/Co/Zn/Cd) transporter
MKPFVLTGFLISNFLVRFVLVGNLAKKYCKILYGTFMGIKYMLGILSGSLALRADSVHSLADVISSLTIIFGIDISDRKTKTFPAGLHKV